MSGLTDLFQYGPEARESDLSEDIVEVFRPISTSKRGGARSSLFGVTPDCRNHCVTAERSDRCRTRMADGVGGAGSIPVPTRFGPEVSVVGAGV